MNEIQATLQQKEKTAQFLWTGFILMFFVIQAIVWIIAITLTSNDKSHAVLPDYDQRALNWNEQVKVRAASEKLGWQSRLSIDETSGSCRCTPNDSVRGLRRWYIHQYDSSR